MGTEELISYGIDYDKGLKNCMGNPAFYKKILSMFLEDQCFLGAKAGYEARDQKELFSRIHELKGISGNAALTEVYSIATPLAELLRHGGADWAEVEPMFAALEAAYVRAHEGISALLAAE